MGTGWVVGVAAGGHWSGGGQAPLMEKLTRLVISALLCCNCEENAEVLILMQCKIKVAYKIIFCHYFHAYKLQLAKISSLHLSPSIINYLKFYIIQSTNYEFPCEVNFLS